jgi:endoglucanase
MGWKTMIGYLRKVGVAKTRGFALNTTHYDWTSNNRAYGEQMARRLNKHFIINTARNGNGPITPRLRAQGYEGGCNIPNAGLGPSPNTQTNSPWVDAYTWTLNPGFGDGPCRHGKNYQTDRVRWDTPLALQLVRQASSRLGSGKIYYHS